MTELGAFVNDGHLGGYRTGGDSATYFPDLWRFLVASFGSQVLDVGCGDGASVDYFADELGCDVLGVDGIPQNNRRIIQHDFATDGRLVLAHGYDFVWACEFVEHVEERYLPHVLDAFRAAPLVFITHAFPGQDGHHHVNCRTADYWIGALAAIGYRLDDPLTQQTRAIAGLNESPWNHYTRSGLAFVRA